MSVSKHTESHPGRGDTPALVPPSSTAGPPRRRTSIGQRSDSTEVPAGKVTQTTKPPAGTPTTPAKTPVEKRDDSDHTRSTSRGSLRLHQPSDPISPASHPKKKRTRTRLSPTERVYEDPEVAKSAFEAERAGNPLHRRAPTPYTSRARRRSGSQSTTGTGASGNESDSEGTTRELARRASARSLRSRVSFESRSRHRGRTGRGGRESGSEEEGSTSGEEAYRPKSTLGVWDPGFGATHGIGPVGEAIEVIGLGRKQPRHRIFQREMLKPALRSAMSSRVDLSSGGQGSGRDKPLPGRPEGIVASVIDVLRSRPSLPPGNVLSRDRGQRGDMGPPTSFRSPQDRYAEPPSPADSSHSSHRHNHEARHTSLDFPRVRSRSFQPPPDAWVSLNHCPPETPIMAPPRPSLRSLFSSFSRNLNLNDPPLRAVLRPRPRSPILLMPPAENLYAYLASVYLAEWQNWPATGGELERRWDSRGKKTGMGWEWFRRLELAEGSRGMRAMVVWEAGDRFWDRRVVDWCQQNVPSEPVDPENRWGRQIFALPAQGYETMEFFDEKAQGAGDHGLLSWVTGSLLQTAVSVLHMLRHSSSPFAFHLIPAPQPPYLPPRPTHTRTGSNSSRKSRSKDGHALWEGFGTLVTVNKGDQSDRSMIVEIRPPSVVTGAVMREFTKPRREWWMLPSETYTGDVGQANLLQCQVYDACVQNQVFFFVVTNLKYWVFGVFNPTYTSATVSPVIDRKAREPSVMQCLTTWLVRSVDERPKATEPLSLGQHPPPPSPQSPVAPPYSQPSQTQRQKSHSRSQSHPTPSPAPYDYASMSSMQEAQQRHQGGWSSPAPHAQQQSYNPYNPYPSPALSEFGYPGYGMHSGGMGMGMQGYGQDGGGYGYGTWSPGAVAGYGGSHSHSPAPQQQGQMGNFWYGSTGWGR